MKKLFGLLLVALMLSGCEIEKINYTTAYVDTFEPENVLTNSASLGGIVYGEGGKNVTEYGIVWSTNSSPTINDHKVVLGSRIGEFFNNYNGFQPATTYYYAAYAINEVGVGYGDVYSFTTTEAAPCNPATNNQVSYNGTNQNIHNVNVYNPGVGSNEGNIEFVTVPSNGTATIEVQFNEYNQAFPQTGTYTVVNHNEFGNGMNLSTGEAKLRIINFGMSGPPSAIAAPGTKFYVKTENNVMSIIFCNTLVGSTTLNGKFSKSF